MTELKVSEVCEPCPPGKEWNREFQNCLRPEECAPGYKSIEWMQGKTDCLSACRAHTERVKGTKNCEVTAGMLCKKCEARYSALKSNSVSMEDLNLELFREEQCDPNLVLTLIKQMVSELLQNLEGYNKICERNSQSYLQNFPNISFSDRGRILSSDPCYRFEKKLLLKLLHTKIKDHGPFSGQFAKCSQSNVKLSKFMKTYSDFKLLLFMPAKQFDDKMR